MEEKNYSLKQLYELVTEYAKEAREEGFDMSVGDFVDWIASRNEQGEIEAKLSDPIESAAVKNNMSEEEAMNYVEAIREEIQEDKNRYVDPVLTKIAQGLNQGEESMTSDLVFRDEGRTNPDDLRIHVHGDTVTSDWKDKPALPEKLYVHSSRDFHDPDVMLDLVLETQDAVNSIIDYLTAKGEEHSNQRVEQIQHRYPGGSNAGAGGGGGRS